MLNFHILIIYTIVLFVNLNVNHIDIHIETYRNVRNIFYFSFPKYKQKL